MKRISCITFLLLCFTAAVSEPADQISAQANPGRTPRQAAQLGIEWLQTAATAWQNEHQCYGCHSQSQVLMGLSVARKNDYRVDGSAYQKLYDFVLKEQFSDGTFRSDFHVTATQFGAMALSYANLPAANGKNEALLKAVDWLLQQQKETGEIPIDHNEPPIDQGSIMSTANSVTAFREAFRQTSDSRYKSAAEKGMKWIESAKEETTQDRAFKIMAFSRFGNATQKKLVPALVRQQIHEQREDGGWAENKDMKGSNAFATGQVLYAFKQGGVSIKSAEFRKGVRFLLDHQRPAGDWPAENTQSNRPSEFAPTMWAVIGLAGSFDEPVTEKGTGYLQVQLQNPGGPSRQVLAIPPDNVELILDMSGSMWQEIHGRTKMEIARDVISSLVKSFPAGAKLGVRVYGHRSKSDCEDTELLVPFGEVNANSIIAKVNELEPKGMTPIDYNLRQAEKDLEPLLGSKVVVLVTDGIESCHGDPVNAAKAMMGADIKVKIDVVGFDVEHSPQAVAQLRKIAETGHGKFFLASTAEQLSSALSEAVKITYSVYDNANHLVYTMPLGSEPHQLTNGYYRIEVAIDPPLALSIQVRKGETSRVNVIHENGAFTIEEAAAK